ncbi:beta-N-acetylhexosaminidase [Pedobacter gandavensis]|uniref:beta-N-acetylhexosaminidase n=1 Tax=Pedobacter gandavensis TaxID=2679963 RepID=A0ABR6ERA7_9SPHI|nr:beta-N-acetylhexosaminidase [Pedobacter gandavensis]MBB2147783.1 family 20 glycosylhydrolase [Pedobacter gandavensis]
MFIRNLLILTIVLLSIDMLYAQAPTLKEDQRAIPALMPLPQRLEKKSGVFDFKSCKVIVVRDEHFLPEAKLLQKVLKSQGIEVKIGTQVPEGSAYLVFDKDEMLDAEFKQEAYRLTVNPDKVVIKGLTRKGVFYGIQTLKQLIALDKKAVACDIVDWPAFSWRGYMVDVGRNFQSVAMLKQQIDVMAAYKLNIFHFHATEDIAWRLESKLYPQLTAPETMLRNKGDFYTVAQIKELIAYCKERNILLVPEIDMPGHSDAFKRAMKTEMQSDTGLNIVKNLLKEFIKTYNLPYVHIGADEVKITNVNFLPEVTKVIEQLGKKVIGWEPGGNFTESTIRQLWMEGATKVSKNKNIQYIDSRHLYLNHMDPLESVATIFNRKISNLDKGNANALGGVICNWPDRNIGKQEDALTQNPVYPSILAFSERSWRGGGIPGWMAKIGKPGSTEALDFREFESRLMQHKERYFTRLPFPYVAQSDISWKLIGPFANGGNLTASFDPESANVNKDSLPAAMEVLGGTIILRHWWTPQVTGVLDKPQENTTWYAYRKIWSEEEETKGFWIGFNNMSRSYASSSPEKGTWDNRKSTVHVNGLLIDPPAWKQAGLSGNMEIPLIDEGYEFRAPTKITLKKGWNDVLIKLPIASFKGVDWKNPQKWMFTFVEANPSL